MKTRRHLALLGLSLATAATVLAAEASPDRIFGAVRIASLDDLAASAVNFANQIKPGSVPDAATLTGSATAFGLAGNRELWALLLDPSLSAQPYALALPVIDPEQIKANPLLGLQAASTTGRYQLKLPNGQPMHAVFAGNTLVMAPEPALLDVALAALADGADPRGLRAGGGQLALSFAVDRIRAAYLPMINLMLMGMRGQMAQAMPGGQGPNPADILTAYVDSFSQLSDTSLRLDIQADRLSFRASATALPNTRAATLFDLGSGPAVQTLGLHDPASAIFGTISASPSPAFWQAYNDLSTELVSLFAPGADPVLNETMQQSINDFAAAWDGTGSYAFLAGEAGLQGSAVLGVGSPEKMSGWIKSFPELQQRLSKLNAAQGLETEVILDDTVTHGDSTLVTFSQRHTATQPEMQIGLEMMKKLGLDDMRTTYAVASRRLVATMGQNSVAKARELLDASEQAPSDVSPTSLGLPEIAHSFTAFSLPAYLRWISQATGLFALPATQAAPAKPGVGISLNLSGGRAESTTVVMISEILALRDLFEAAQTTASAPTAQE